MENKDTEGKQVEPGSPEYLELYGDSKIASFEGTIPAFLKWTYIILPIWGIFQFYYFWNGSAGWFDRGYWRELQIAANTTFPIENQNMMPAPVFVEEHSQESTVNTQ